VVSRLFVNVAGRALPSDVLRAISTAGNEAAQSAETASQKSGRQSACAPHRGLILKLLDDGLSAERIWRDLRDDHGFTHSYESVKRFVSAHKARHPKRVWRIECNPGEEAQIDFGMARTLRTADGKLRSSNVLRVTLSFSRKGYTETMPKQDTECFLRALENAFHHFGGVPATLRVRKIRDVE
jgi:transposase